MDLGLDFDKLVNLRHQLHARAELSNQEEETAQLVINFIEQFEPDQIWDNVGGHGVIALFKGETDGENIAFRADLDALHIAETIELDYASKTPHTAHKCGHDGHMTMVAGIASYLSKHNLKRGNVYLVFQPAEETGEGAERISHALSALDIQLDYIFGLHNLPGFPESEILSTEGTFSAASRGMVIKLFGKTSHAAEPEFGISPVLAIARITSKMTKVHENSGFTGLTLATVIHSELGEIAFGTSPGYGEIRITLRAMLDQDMQRLIDIAENMVKEESKKEHLDYEISYTETFPVTENTEEAYQIMKQAAESVGLEFKQLDKPFKWSEDFGQYKLENKSGFFGLGAGEDCPHLHDETYDFPDQIILSGVKMYVGLMKYFNLI